VAIAGFYLPIHRITQAFAGYFRWHFPLHRLPCKFIYQDYAAALAIKVQKWFVVLLSLEKIPQKFFLEAESLIGAMIAQLYLKT
jgi:hypothetical protein